MKKKLFLRRYEYVLPAPSVTMTMAENTRLVTKYPSLLKVNIDFEHGILKLDSDRPWSMAANKQNEGAWSGYHRDGIKLEASIYSDTNIDLNDSCYDGLVLPIEGNIKNDNYLGSCSGLMVMDNVRKKNGRISNQWIIWLCFYDLPVENCQLKFKIPVFADTTRSDLN